MSEKQRVIVVGIDGATFYLLDPWIENGLLPNLKYLKGNGAWGLLESTLPPLTAPAWASFLTGKNPANHCIFDWQGPMRNTRTRPLNDSRNIRAVRLFDVLNYCGRKVGLVNIPMTYPPEPIDSFMVGGILTPSLNCDFTYPRELKAELLGKFGFKLDVDVGRYPERSISNIVDNLIDVERRRMDASIYLLRKNKLDLFALLFTGSDRIQHRYWHYLDPQHPLFSRCEHERFFPALLRYYVAIDNYIGTFLKELGSKDLLLVISDHGFGPFSTEFHLDEWLRDENLLQFNFVQKTRCLAKKLLTELRLNTFYYHLFKRGKLVNLVLKSAMAVDTVYRMINWNKTLAYSGSSTQQAIYLNLAGREPFGVIQDGTKREEIIRLLVSELLSLKDTKRRLVMEEVMRRSDVYKGAFADEAPDIVFTMKRGYRAVCSAGCGGVFRDKTRHDFFLSTGGHDKYGVFLAYGNEVTQGFVRGAKIVDLMPTILYFLGIAVPNDCDGKALLSIFAERYRTANKVYFGNYIGVSRRAKESSLHGAEESLIKRRLRQLGYL